MGLDMRKGLLCLVGIQSLRGFGPRLEIVDGAGGGGGAPAAAARRRGLMCGGGSWNSIEKIKDEWFLTFFCGGWFWTFLAGFVM